MSVSGVTTVPTKEEAEVYLSITLYPEEGRGGG